MDRAKRTVVLTGVGVVVGAAVLGYGAGLLVEKVSGPSSPTAGTAPSVGPTVSPPALATPQATAPLPETVAVVSPYPRPSARPPVAPVQLTIGSVPAVARAGEPVVIGWRVWGGPVGTVGTSTRLVTTHSRAPNVTSTVVQSFPVPARYESFVTASVPGALSVTAEAIVNGQTLRATQQIVVK